MTTEIAQPAETYDRPLAGLDRSYVPGLLQALEDAAAFQRRPDDCNDDCTADKPCPDHLAGNAMAAGYERTADRIRESLRHPQVTYWNAINSERQTRCYPDPATAYDAAATTHPYNNTRVTFGHCNELHPCGLASS